MKKKSYAKPIAILVGVIGAYHVVLFGLHPHLPTVDKTEVIWGEMSEKSSSLTQSPDMAAKFCSEAVENNSNSDPVKSVDTIAKRVRFEYRPVASNIVNTGDAAKIVMGDGSSITIGKFTYPLQQIQFKKNSSTGKIDFYLIHRMKDGKSAVVTVPLRLTSVNNPTIDALWRYLPKQRGDHNSLDDLHVDINNLLPQDRTYYHYQGNSKCGNNTIMLGLKAPVEISSKQLAKLNKVLIAKNG